MLLGVCTAGSVRSLPLLSIPLASFVAGILRAGGPTEAPWVAVACLGLWMASSRRLSARVPLLRAWTVASAFFCAGSWTAGPPIGSARSVASLLPDDGTRIATVCLLAESVDRSRSARAQCLFAEEWISMRIRILSDRPIPAGEGWILGALQRPGGSRNPGEPDRLSLATRSGVGAWLVVTDRDSVSVVEGHGPAAAATVRSRIDALYGKDAAGTLVRAMLTGEREELPESVSDAFRATGIAHVLAVSGLHVSLVLLLVTIPASFAAAVLPIRYRARTVAEALCSVALLWIVVAVTGPRPSVLRAAFLGLTVVASRLSDRSGSGARSALLFSALVQLADDPAVLTDPGFLLSHAAVAGLLSVGREHGWSSGIVASFAATWATAPIVAFYFDRIPLAAIITNVIAIPLTSAVVIAGVLSLLPTPWHGEFAFSATVAADLLIRFAARSSDLLGFLALRADPVVVSLVVAVPACFGLRGRKLFAATLIPSAALLGSAALPLPSPFRYVALDTGQGDAQVLVSTRGTPYVVDTGPPTSLSLERWIDRSGVSAIGAVFLTHLHADHTGRWTQVAAKLRVDSLFLPLGSRFPDSLRFGVGVRFLAAGDVVRLDDGTVVRVLAPERGAVGDDENALSLVLHVRHGDTTLLLTGDAEAPSEASMTSRWDDFLQADVVKVGHHGSRTSSAPWFVSRIGADHAVVSVGRNGYGLPNTEILSRWARSGARVHVTRRDGAFCLSSYGTAYRTGCR